MAKGQTELRAESCLLFGFGRFPGFRGFGFSSLLFCAAFGAFLRRLFGGGIARIAEQLDDRQLSAVACAAAQLDDARVATWPILEALAQLIEQTLERRNSRRARRNSLSAPAG